MKHSKFFGYFGIFCLGYSAATLRATLMNKPVEVAARSGDSLVSLHQPSGPTLDPGQHTNETQLISTLLGAKQGFNTQKQFIEMLADVTVGGERAFLNIIKNFIDEGRLTSTEVAILCEWISERDCGSVVSWLQSLSPEAVAGYGMMKTLLSAVAAHSSAELEKLISSPYFKNKDVPAVFVGLLASDPERAKLLLNQTALDVSDPRRMVKVSEMQSLLIKSTLRKNGLDGVLELLASAEGSSKVKYAADGKTVVGATAGVNSNLISQFFAILPEIKPIKPEVVLNALQASQWFGIDMLATQSALSRLAKLDGALALEQAFKLTSANQIPDSRYVSSAFSGWVENDERGALLYLNTNKLANSDQNYLVSALYNSAKDSAVKQESRQLMIERGIELPEEVQIR